MCVCVYVCMQSPRELLLQKPWDQRPLVSIACLVMSFHLLRSWAKLFSSCSPVLHQLTLCTWPASFIPASGTLHEIFSARCLCGCRSVLLRRRFSLLRTSGFVDDFMFSNGSARSPRTTQHLGAPSSGATKPRIVGRAGPSRCGIRLIYFGVGFERRQMALSCFVPRLALSTIYILGRF